MAPPCRRDGSPSPPALLPELVEEILLRVPPDEPAHLVRAALVCKPWRRILSDHDFLRRYRRFHRSPPLLGYIHNFVPNECGPVPPFVPTTVASPLSPLTLDCDSWSALDCCHGRVLILAYNPECIVIWDPITDEQKKLSVPPYPYDYYTGVVLCAMDGCDHLDCHGGPFLVVFVGTSEDPSYGPRTWASEYSSETGVWSASVDFGVINYIDTKPGLLIGDALYFTFRWGVSIIKYDLRGHVITDIIEPPRVYGSIAMEVEDGALGFVGELDDNCIYKWLWQPSANNGTGGWAQHMATELETLLPRPARYTCYEVNGVMEGTDTIFISGDAGVFTLDLKSRKAKMVGKSGPYCVILPYMSFYTPDLVKGRTVTAMKTQ